MKYKLTKEEREIKNRSPKKEDRPITKEDLEALLEHFGQIKNLPK